MRLRLVRTHLKDTYTIGYLYIDGKYFCDVLEDKVRDLNKDGDLDEAGEEKIFGETAIPYGTYEIVITRSERFKRDLPLLLNVKGFDGIRIHGGTTALDTHGCLCVGDNSEVGKITKSQITLEKVITQIQKGLKDGKVFIDIV